ncbi:hypothetical protein [Mucisphaera calidilacus]|uniref:Dockerin domain-containing protein n=1 Tax=Mucisphaera calidilacus TaxID=2527982 RepID=A0A518BXV8_9BACT|nr:hypothetical protein [Mucisphaera calidilacus]QDU71815.1 hypothetical protein Pan265_16680 [Mucisphaera calidilacus]
MLGLTKRGVVLGVVLGLGLGVCPAADAEPTVIDGVVRSEGGNLRLTGDPLVFTGEAYAGRLPTEDSFPSDHAGTITFERVEGEGGRFFAGVRSSITVEATTGPGLFLDQVYVDTRSSYRGVLIDEAERVSIEHAEVLSGSFTSLASELAIGAMSVSGRDSQVYLAGDGLQRLDELVASEHAWVGISGLNAGGSSSGRPSGWYLSRLDFEDATLVLDGSVYETYITMTGGRLDLGGLTGEALNLGYRTRFVLRESVVRVEEPYRFDDLQDRVDFSRSEGAVLALTEHLLPNDAGVLHLTPTWERYELRSGERLSNVRVTGASLVGVDVAESSGGRGGPYPSGRIEDAVVEVPVRGGYPLFAGEVVLTGGVVLDRAFVEGILTVDAERDFSIEYLEVSGLLETERGGRLEVPADHFWQLRGGAVRAGALVVEGEVSLMHGDEAASIFGDLVLTDEATALFDVTDRVDGVYRLSSARVEVIGRAELGGHAEFRFYGPEVLPLFGQRELLMRPSEGIEGRFATVGGVMLGEGLGLAVWYSDYSVLTEVAYLGDADLDRRVDLDDLSVLAEHFGEDGAVWREGDFNGDGVVDLMDLSLLAGNFGRSGVPAVPEPGVGLLLGVGLVLRGGVRG